MHINEKIAVADALQRLNVDIIEAGYPAASEGDFEAVRQIAKRIRTAEITGLARCKQHDIDVLWNALRYSHRSAHWFASALSKGYFESGMAARS